MPLIIPKFGARFDAGICISQTKLHSFFKGSPKNFEQSIFFLNIAHCLQRRHFVALEQESPNTRGKEKIEKLPCERFLQDFEVSRAFLPPVSHGIKRGKFQKPVKIAHKAVALI